METPSCNVVTIHRGPAHTFVSLRSSRRFSSPQLCRGHSASFTQSANLRNGCFSPLLMKDACKMLKHSQGGVLRTFCPSVYTSLSFISSPNQPCPVCRKCHTDSHKCLPKQCQLTMHRAEWAEVLNPNLSPAFTNRPNPDWDWCLNLCQWHEHNTDGTFTCWDFNQPGAASSCLGSCLLPRGHHG